MLGLRSSFAFGLSVAAVLLGAGLWALAGDVALPGPDWLHGHHRALLQAAEANPWTLGFALFGLFVGMSALALPGCSLLAMAAGLCFGFVGGTLLVALASTVGASLPFLVARHWARDRVRARWGRRLEGLEAALARDGALCVFALRMVPVIPFPVLNPLLGLTGMPALRYFWASLLGMLAGSAAYVQAGIELQRAVSAGGWVSPSLAALVLALVLLALAGRRLALRKSLA